MSKIKIGLFGFGCVGQGLYEILQKEPAHISIAKICIRNPHKERIAPSHLFTTDPSEIIENSEIDLVVELTDDAGAAFRIASEAIRNGKPVVSANKKMIADNLLELIHLQQLYKTPILYEASCCASIPIIRNLEDYYQGAWLESLEGIVNGSTNYILSNIFDKGSTLQESLAEAQLKGYAESNPLLDTSGADARSKLGILVAHAFGVIAQQKDIACIGIQNLHPSAIQYAIQARGRIKLLARTWKSGSTISAVVAPHLVFENHKLYNVSGVFNGVSAKSKLNNSQFFHGEGAGAHPTANAVLADILAIQRGYRYSYAVLQQPSGIELDKQIKVRVIIVIDHEFGECNLPILIEKHIPFGGGTAIQGSVRIDDLEILQAQLPGQILLLN